MPNITVPVVATRGNRIVAEVPFPHTAISDFISAVKDFLCKRVYSKFEYSMIGSFNKAIQYIDQLNSNTDTLKKGSMNSNFPMIVFTPGLEEPVPQTDFLWNYIGTHPYMTVWNHDSIIFEDENCLNLCTRRMKGNIEIKIFCDSQMEEHDIQMSFLNWFRGLNTWVSLNNISQQFILAEKIYLFKDKREEKVLDLNNSTIKHKLITSTGRTEYVIPISGAPLIQLTSLSDSSSMYGGTGLPEYGLSGSIQYELEIPCNIVLMTDVLVDSIELGFEVDTSSAGSVVITK